MADWLDDLRRIIADSRAVNFGTAADAPTDEWLERSEQRLGVTLPPSYKWWLKNYGGGDIHGEEIFSIYGIDFDEAVGCDIVFANGHRRLPAGRRLAICDTGADEEFYFDIAHPDSKGEYPVMLFEHPDRETVYAENFGEFLRKRIEYFSRNSTA